MGKLSMVVVVGFAVIVGVIGTAFNKRTAEGQSSNISTFEKAQARNIAKSATEIYTRALTKDSTLKGNFQMSILGGSATVSITEKTPGNRKNLGFATNARYGNSVKNISLDAEKDDFVPPTITGAIGISFLSRAKFKMGKGTEIDGNNHDLNGNISMAFPSVAGISLGHPDQLSGLDYTPKDVKIKGKGSVDPNIETQAPQPDYYAWAMKLAEKADAVYDGKDVTRLVTLGTVASPQITYVKGNSKFREALTGAGVLIIDGDCKFSKEIDFTGLIFAVGDSLDSERAAWGGRGSTIIGAVMVAGKKVTVKTGNVRMLYSAEAVNRALGVAISRMRATYSFSNWRE